MPAPKEHHRPMTAFEMDAPLAQAARCLDCWLKEEGRTLSPRLRQKAAALIARYFLYEDCTTDALIMSFLRHYAGFRAIDMEDPASVRQALRTVLDQSVIAEPLPSPFFLSRTYVRAAAVFLCLLMTVLYFRPAPVAEMISPMQQSVLKQQVKKITTLEKDASPAAVWAAVKRPFAVRSYKQLTTTDYAAAKAFLDEWITQLETSAPSSRQASLGARM